MTRLVYMMVISLRIRICITGNIRGSNRRTILTILFGEEKKKLLNISWVADHSEGGN